MLYPKEYPAILFLMKLLYLAKVSYHFLSTIYISRYQYYLKHSKIGLLSFCAFPSRILSSVLMVSRQGLKQPAGSRSWLIKSFFLPKSRGRKEVQTRLAYHCSTQGTLQLSCSYVVRDFVLFVKQKLKVIKSRKQILKFSFEPKNEQKYFCISALASKNP